VREVVRLRKLARVPDGRAPFRGLISLRGEVVTVLGLEDLQKIAAAGASPKSQETTGSITTGSIRPGRIEAVVVLRGAQDPLGLDVDGVEDIRDFASGTGAPVPPPGPPGGPSPGRLWAGIVRDEKGEIGVLDADAVYAFAEELSREVRDPEPVEVDDRG
jgi:chemotaxis signal transduction protein